MFVGEVGESNLSEGGLYPTPKESGFRPQKHINTRKQRPGRDLDPSPGLDRPG